VLVTSLTFAVGAAIGAKVFHLAATAASAGVAASEQGTAIELDGGWSYYGAVIGGLVASALTLRESRPLALFLDLLALPLALAHLCGRLGCFLRGCCFGKSGGWWPVHPGPGSMAYENHLAWGVLPDLGRTTSGLHPVQLYEAALLVVLIPLLWWIMGRRRFAGQVALTYLGLYSLGRFVVEMFRGDRARGFLGEPVAWVSFNRWLGVDGGSATALSVPQFLALVTALACLWAYFLMRPVAQPSNKRSRIPSS
jgi:phosphatidylglycerol:prolipoprotein diacylglycerol transferase